MKIHGTLHAARTCLLVATLAELEGIPEREIYALMLAAVIHDLGRKNNSNDAGHGERSINEVKTIDMELVNNVVRFHSRGDRTFKSNQFKKQIELFKDADALDRARTGDIDVSYLRTISAKALIHKAKELYTWTLNTFTRLGGFVPSNHNTRQKNKSHST